MGAAIRNLVRLGLLLALAGLVLVGGPATNASQGITTRVSLDSAGNEGNSWSWYAALSSDGRYVAFHSSASNLVPGDTGWADVFVRDRATGTTERVSVDSAGNQGNENSWYAAISADGRYVAFWSQASDLVASDTNGTADVFVHDRQTGATERVSVNGGGGQGNDESRDPAISADGCCVAFDSLASDLVLDDTNGARDVFVHDRQTGAIERVSVSDGGGQGNGESRYPAISADGRYVAFDSLASDLVPGDTNSTRDIFVHDRQTGATERVSVSGGGGQANRESRYPAINGDGRYVDFDSLASNLVLDDANGATDIFVHDRQTGATQRVSVDSSGSQGNSHSYNPAISADGRYPAFYSSASNLVLDDTNDAIDVFVHDRETGATQRVSVDSSGNQANNYSHVPVISADGRYVAFHSSASNLVPNDTTGNLDVFVHDRGSGSAGGIARLPGVPESSGRDYGALAGLAAAALIVVTVGAWYARKRWV